MTKIITYKKFKYVLILGISVWLLLPAVISAKGDGQKGQKLSKTEQGNQRVTAAMNINNLNAEQSVYGYSDFNPNGNLEGTVYPKGTGKNAFFKSGFLWAGYPNGDTSQVYTGGSVYGSSLQPGPILADGHPADPTDPKWSIYRVRPDVYPGGPNVDLSEDAASSSYWNPAAPLTADQIKTQYDEDWTNWPAEYGAPYTDANGVYHPNGGTTYDPSTCTPGIKGADQTIFYIANDENPDLGSGFYGAPPLGIEMHVTMWAYSQQGALGDMYFKRYQLINKGYQKYTIDSMFVSWWADVDLGSASDDVVGNDTTLSMTYVYNGYPTDAVYNPLPPPCSAADFFQGPVVVGSPSDSAIFFGKVIHGFKNLPMTAAYTFTNPGSGGPANFNDPDLYVLTGSTQFYHFMNGQDRRGAPIIDPQTGQITKFIFPGNPVTGTGWIDNGTTLNLSPRDVRSGMASGPFNMAPGDTQEVVVAEIVAGAVPGVDYLHAISLAKVYDKTAQNGYDNFFNFPSAPPAPLTIGLPLNNKVALNWGFNHSKVTATESSVIHDVIDSIDVTGGGDYRFEGYNIYQLPYYGASKDQGKIIATYDIIDNVTTIPYTDPVTRTVEPSISIQSGSDSGIRRYFVDSVDAFNGNKPLNNGTPYYFAVTAYSYNPKGVPQALENPLSIITVTPTGVPPGIKYQNEGDLPSSLITHEGTANATINVNVVDPQSVTGDKYQVVFHNEIYSLGANGKWVDITPPRKIGKITDLTGSSLVPSAAWSEKKGSFEMHFMVDVVSPDYDFCDGIQLQLPSNITVDSILTPISSWAGVPISYTYDMATNTIMYGNIARDSAGLFGGGEDIVIISHTANLPIIANYTMYDDGYGGNIVDVSGTDTINTIANLIVTQKQWDVVDSTKGTIALANQTVIDGNDIYAPQYYFSQNGVYGPGGSSGSPTESVGSGANVIFDGIQVMVNGSYDAPTTFKSLELNGSPLEINAGSGIYQMSDFSLSFSGFGAGAMAYNTIIDYGGAGGTHSVNQLQQDYEIKWTGVRKTTVTGGDTVVSTGSGGQLATLFGASAYDIADDPANPTPGSSNPFLLRIPFEVWNIDKNEQVNVLVWHRLGNVTDNPFNEWNYFDRMYVWIVNTKYDSTAPISDTAQVVADSATWNWVFFQSDYNQGDVIKVTYANPLQMGQDKFNFTVPAQTYSTALAKQDVNKINVFPNPYYGVNYLETSKYARFVTFSHLPQSATIRIFNIAGFMVRTIVHSSNSTFEQWDLNNSSGLPVASGLYIAYIDMPKIGATKILKFAIIQEQQMPDHF